MKYVVTLEKKVQKIVVVDAENDDEAQKKLENCEFEVEYEKIITRDVYNGYEFESSYSVEPDDLIKCEKDLLDEYGCKTREELERYFYKYTDCGMPIWFLKNGIELVGYVEGADCDGPSEILSYPFTKETLNSTINQLERAADEMWHEWNDVNEEEEE